MTHRTDGLLCFQNRCPMARRKTKMAEWLSEWNNLGPVMGILVSFLGFTVAVFQIRRTTKAVDAAKTAVDSTRDAFIRTQVLATITRLMERTQEMRTLYSDEQWDRAYYRYNDLWIMLTNASSQYPCLKGTQRKLIEELVVQLQENERSLERAVRSNKPPTKIQEHVKAFQRLQVILSELSTNLH